MEEVASEADVFCRLHLIPRQHPDPHPRLPQSLDRRWYSLLQLVLDRRDPDESHPLLDHLRRSRQLLLPVYQRRRRRPVRLIPPPPLLLSQPPLRQHQRPQPLHRVAVQRSVDPSPLLLLHLHPLHHDVVRPLAQQNQLSSCHAADHRHPLPCRGELVDIQDLELLLLPQHVHHLLRRRLPAEAEAQHLGCRHQRPLVRRLGLVEHAGRVPATLWYHRMAD
mmetsp:Transcript_21031/g.47377  ORF Transcript_21031/g.47377 Transcript_21031/m.47377 type:complete len:221 (-) Transcript_21031:157-819(-)